MRGTQARLFPLSFSHIAEELPARRHLVQADALGSGHAVECLRWGGRRESSSAMGGGRRGSGRRCQTPPATPPLPTCDVGMEREQARRPPAALKKGMASAYAAMTATESDGVTKNFLPVICSGRGGDARQGGGRGRQSCPCSCSCSYCVPAAAVPLAVATAPASC